MDVIDVMHGNTVNIQYLVIMNNISIEINSNIDIKIIDLVQFNRTMNTKMSF